MAKIELEYRIAETHIGEGLIGAQGVAVHAINPCWSYARHLLGDWDLSNILKRTIAANQLLANLEKTADGTEMDLSPLRNDQRASGFVYGQNPLQNMYDLIREYANRFPECEFFGKWGGYEPHNSGKRFVFYIEDADEAKVIAGGLREIASQMGIPISAGHQYGIVQYQEFVDINDSLRSPVRNREGFKQLLEGLDGYPHFFHELFLA